MTPETPVETLALGKPLAAALLLLSACAPTANAPAPAVPAPVTAPAPASAAAVTPPLPSGANVLATAPLTEAPAPWWDAPYPKPFDPARLAKRLSPIHVDGNHFADEAGKTFVFEGVSIADPDWLIRKGHWDRALFAAIASWGANIVRVPVHPASFHGRGAQSYFELLDQAVIWANEFGMYVIVDWHSIGNLGAELFQHPMYDTTRGETYQFWRSVAFRYQHVPSVALYELFNEPTVFNGKLGAIAWSDWKRINEELIDILRAYNPDAIPLVAGFDWAYDLRPVAQAPVGRKNVAYVSHPYPHKAKPPFEPKWEQSFGFVATKYPLVATEIGYNAPGSRGAQGSDADTPSYPKDISDYLVKKGASWVAWCFNPDWGPPLISDWSYAPTPSGVHFRAVMLEHTGKSSAPAAGPSQASHSAE